MYYIAEIPLCTVADSAKVSVWVRCKVHSVVLYKGIRERSTTYTPTVIFNPFAIVCWSTISSTLFQSVIAFLEKKGFLTWSFLAVGISKLLRLSRDCLVIRCFFLFNCLQEQDHQMILKRVVAGTRFLV